MKPPIIGMHTDVREVVTYIFITVRPMKYMGQVTSGHTNLQARFSVILPPALFPVNVNYSTAAITLFPYHMSLLIPRLQQ